MVGDSEIQSQDIEAMVKAAKKRKVSEEGNSDSRGEAKRIGRLSKRELLSEDKNNQSMKNFLSPRLTSSPIKQPI